MQVTRLQSSVNRYQHVDALRAFAVMLVVVAHAGLGSVVPGGSGVTIFFAISGFIITYLLMREFEKTGTFAIGFFYGRRCLKILPPLFFIVVLPTVIYSFFQQLDWFAFGGQVFFFYNWILVTSPSGGG